MAEPYPVSGILHITRKTYFQNPDIGRKTYDRCSYAGALLLEKVALVPMRRR